MLIKIGKEWLTKEEGGCFTATHLSPSQLNKPTDQWFNDYCVLTAAERKQLPANSRMICGAYKIPDQWFYDYCVLTAAERKQLPANSRMIFGGLVGQALQDIIVHKLTIQEVMRGKK